MISILAALAGQWLTILITTGTIFILFAILFVVILIVRKKAQNEQKEEKKEVNLAELQQILDNIKAKQAAEAENKEEIKDGE